MSTPDPLPAREADQLAALRRELQAQPEASGNEERTAALMRAFLGSCCPSTILDRLGGGHSLAAVFAAPSDGKISAGGGDLSVLGADSDGISPTVVLRAELDALPIKPQTSPGAVLSHACGHDGHLAMLGGMALDLARKPLRQGSVVLLCQAAEETGQGARAVADDPRWRRLQADHVFALHNLPGHPLGQILLREGPFTAGSVGMIIRLQGRTAHAAYPEQGLSPAMALSRLVPGLVSLPIALEAQGRLALVTVVHARLGEVSFGTSPADAQVMATLRADRDEVLVVLRKRAEELARQEAHRDGLSCEVAWVEEFPVTVNATASVALASRAACRAQLSIARPEESPFRWSEDFGWLLQRAPGALIGIGSGLDQPVLHASDYVFPDVLLPLGVRFYTALLSELGLR